MVSRKCKNLVSGAATLSIIGLIAATTFLFVPTAKAVGTTPNPTDFCSHNLPSGASQTACVTLVTTATLDTGQKTLLQNKSFMSKLQKYLKVFAFNTTPNP